MKAFAMVAPTLLLLALSSTAVADDAMHYVKPAITHENFGEVKIVVPITTGEAPIWKFKLHNALNAVDGVRTWGGNSTIIFVMYGHGVDLMLSSDPEVTKAIEMLRAAGARFEVCNNTLMGLDLDFHKMNGVTDADVVPSGFLEVPWLQTAKGFKVDPMN